MFRLILLFTFFLSLLFAFLLPAQELPRRSFLGVRLEPVTDDVARVMELPSAEGVLITQVFPNSSAAAAGFRERDVLLALNGQAVRTTAEVVTFAGGQSEGSPYSYKLLREGKTVEGQAKFSGYPRESYADLTVEYGSATTPLGRQSLIVLKPKKVTGRRPLVVFIGGYSCYSLDTPFDTLRGDVQLTNNLARAGYIVVRAEKPGMGDGQRTSKPCGEIGFHEEASGYTAMIRQLKQRPDVDSSAVYIFGHSMGGVMAPLVAQVTPIRGIISYGTIGSNFLEYLLKTRRTIAAAYQMAPDSTDNYIKLSGECAGYYFVQGMTTEEAAALNPECDYYLSVFDERARAYNDELYALNIPGAWAPFRGRALFLWGAADYIASREDHDILAATVDHYHQGHAEMQVIPNATHGMDWADDFMQARTDPGPYNPAVHQVVLKWLGKV